jgi:drug/metabolite transporter (DMT)-like permease
MKPKTLAYLLLLGTVLVWGCSFALVKAALQDASPLAFNLVRFVLATIAMACMNWRTLGGIRGADWKAGAIAGLFLAGGYQLQTLGLARTTAAKSAFITGLVVVFVPALTLIPAVRPEGVKRPGVSAALGAVLAFVGLILLTTPAGTAWRDCFSSMGLGDLLTLGCCISFAAHLLTLARVSKTMPVGLLATLQIGFAAVFMLASLPLEPRHFVVTPRLIGTLLLCALLATAAAFTIQSYAQKVLPPTHTVVLLTLEPVFAWVTSVLVLHEGLKGRAMVGAGLIFMAILVIEFLPVGNSTEIPA